MELGRNRCFARLVRMNAPNNERHFPFGLLAVFPTLCGFIGYGIDGREKLVLWLILGAVISLAAVLAVVMRGCMLDIIINLNETQLKLTEIKHELARRK